MKDQFTALALLEEINWFGSKLSQVIPMHFWMLILNMNC